MHPFVPGALLAPLAGLAYGSIVYATDLRGWGAAIAALAAGVSVALVRLAPAIAATLRILAPAVAAAIREVAPAVVEYRRQTRAAEAPAPAPPPPPALAPSTIFGLCPICSAPGVIREKRPDGLTTCLGGHVCPTSSYRPAPDPEASRP